MAAGDSLHLPRKPSANFAEGFSCASGLRLGPAPLTPRDEHLLQLIEHLARHELPTAGPRRPVIAAPPGLAEPGGSENRRARQAGGPMVARGRPGLLISNNGSAAGVLSALAAEQQGGQPAADARVRGRGVDGSGDGVWGQRRGRAVATRHGCPHFCSARLARACCEASTVLTMRCSFRSAAAPRGRHGYALRSRQASVRYGDWVIWVS